MGYKLRLTRDTDLYVLTIVDSKSGYRTEVRGKSNYETDGYDSDDALHKLLDVIGKSANISELMNSACVSINYIETRGVLLQTKHSTKRSIYLENNAFSC